MGDLANAAHLKPMRLF